MANEDAQAQEVALRRVRSTGDIHLVRSPERAHIPDLGRNHPSPPTSPSYQIQSSQRAYLDARRSAHVTQPTPMYMSPTVSPQEPPPRQSDNQNRNRPAQPSPDTSLDPFIVKVLRFFGVGRRASRERRLLISLVWKLSWGFMQFVVIITMLILVGVHYKSTNNPNLSEWTACDRPLGTWASLWVIRDVLASILSYWDYKRDLARATVTQDPENNTGANIPTNPPIAPGHNRPNSNLIDSTTPATAAQAENNVVLPYSRLYSRLTLLSSLMTLSWFLTAHILEYTSINTCRRTSPHLWWLVFGILCILYLMVLEVVLLGVIVLVVAPILFVFWNIFIICLGRHPLQNPGAIKPAIGKLSQTAVERIPLVIYIPPPPENEREPGMKYPHEYPPTKIDSRKNNASTRRRFKLLSTLTRSKKNRDGHDSEKNEKGKETENENSETGDQGPLSWPEHWEQGEYPFVALEGNRAACAICLMDFEEPQRKDRGGISASAESKTTTKNPEKSGESNKKKKNQENAAVSTPTSPPNSPVTQTSINQLPTLTDAGDGAQPLRLLACSHVFHKSCLDPWLTQVSGRCPVCQRPVEVPPEEKKPQGSR